MDEDKIITIDEKIAIKELEEKIEGMKKDKRAKCKAAKEQLIEQLRVTVDKYRTATGTAEALRVLGFVLGDVNFPRAISIANGIAYNMAEVANEMMHEAEKLPYNDMDKLCDGFYDPEFIIDEEYANIDNAINLATEMMRIDLCRNVGGAAEDMVQFIKRVQEEIDATGEELKKLKAKQKED